MQSADILPDPSDVVQEEKAQAVVSDPSQAEKTTEQSSAADSKQDEENKETALAPSRNLGELQ